MWRGRDFGRAHQLAHDIKIGAVGKAAAGQLLGEAFWRERRERQDTAGAGANLERLVQPPDPARRRVGADHKVASSLSLSRKLEKGAH